MITLFSPKKLLLGFKTFCSIHGPGKFYSSKRVKKKGIPPTLSQDSKQPFSSFPKDWQDILSVFFWACLFFLCSADRVFNIEFHGFHFRWGQFLLGIALL